MSARVLLLSLGEAPEPVRRQHGPFASWYQRAWGWAPAEGGAGSEATTPKIPPLHVHDGRAGGPGPDPRDFAGIVITGSTTSLTQVEPWMDDAAALVVRAHDVGVPVLGVCFGHQLVGHAFGAKVVRNPAGWELGSFDVAVNDDGRADPLLAGLPPTLRVNLVHQDMVIPSPATRVLAGSERTAVQILAVGDHVRGVQFHPEITGAILRGYIDARRSLLTSDDPDQLIAAAADSPDAVAVLHNFRDRLVGAAPRFM